MYTSAFAIIVLATTALAALPDDWSDLDKRYSSGITGHSGTFHICTMPQFEGNCYAYTVDKGSCYNFGPGIADEASSFSSPGSLGTCQMYSQWNCIESRQMAGLPGGTVDTDLYRPRRFDNANRSVKCGITFHPFQGDGYKRSVGEGVVLDSGIPTLVGEEVIAYKPEA